MKTNFFQMRIAEFRIFLRKSANSFLNLCSNSDNSIKLQQIDTMDKFLNSLLAGSNNPPEGSVVFDSSDHIRFQNGQNVSGHNYGCNRRLVIEKNIEGGEGYTITMYNLDGIHPIWQNNIQMAPKRMRVVSVNDDIVELRGYGFDQLGGNFADYGLSILFVNDAISRLQLNMYDRNVCILYLK